MNPEICRDKHDNILLVTIILCIIAKVLCIICLCMYTQKLHLPLSIDPMAIPLSAINTPNIATWIESGMITVAACRKGMQVLD